MFEPDPERFAEPWAGAQHRVPSLKDVEVVKVVNGPEAFTPDGEFLLGETSVNGLWVAAGFCVHGLAAAGGVGKSIAEWMVDGQPELDMSGMDIRRFGRHYGSRRLARTRALDAYSKYYDIVYPHEERDAGRQLRRSSAYPRLVELGAAFGEKAEVRSARTRLPGQRRRKVSGAGRVAATMWSPAIQPRCLRDSRPRRTIQEQDLVRQADAAGARRAGYARARLRKSDRSAARKHRVHADAQRSRRDRVRHDSDPDREEYVPDVTGTASARRDREWIRRHRAPGARVSLQDITGTEVSLPVVAQPPLRSSSRPVTTPPDSRRCRPAGGDDPGGGGCAGAGAASRLSSATRFELRAPRRIWPSRCGMRWLPRRGRGHGIVAAGYRALDSIRVEKGYRAWAPDVTPVVSPLQAGLGFAVRARQAHQFIGREALGRRPDPAQRIRAIVLDEPRSVVLGFEAIRARGEICRLSSPPVATATGSTPSIAYGYLPTELGPGTRVEISMFDQWVPATVAAEPLYDPDGERPRRTVSVSTAPVRADPDRDRTDPLTSING